MLVYKSMLLVFMIWTYYLCVSICIRVRCFLAHTEPKCQDIKCHHDIILNTLRPRKNGRHFADDTFKRIFMNENVRISTNISLKFIPRGLINNMPALVQIMAWRWPGDNPLSEPMMVNLLTHICVNRPQWVKLMNHFIFNAPLIITKSVWFSGWWDEMALTLWLSSPSGSGRIYVSCGHPRRDQYKANNYWLFMMWSGYDMHSLVWVLLP